MIQKGTNLVKEQSKNRAVIDNKLERITFLDRRVYKRDEGVFYPSVTTILQYLPKGKFFEQWIKDVGHNADVIMRRAANEGTQVHDAIESLLLGNEIEWLDEYGNAKYNQIVWEMIGKFVEFWSTYKPKLIGTEEFVFSDEYKYAGTTDIVCEIDNEIWLIDIKTSNNLTKSYDLQLASYAKAWEEIKNQKIDKTGILWLKSTKRGPSTQKGKIQGKGWELKVIDNIQENFEKFMFIYEIYKMDNPEQDPIYSKLPFKYSL